MSDDNTITEADLVNAIEEIIRKTKKAYGYQHLATIGSDLRNRYPGFSPKQYGYKKLLELIEAHPDRFMIKWSAPAHKGRSHVWVRLADEPKRKSGNSDNVIANITPRLMTADELARLCDWLTGPKGCHFRPDPNNPDEVVWECDGSLRKTRQWLRRRAFLDMKRNINVIKELGGYCDCEVVFNAQGSWPEA